MKLLDLPLKYRKLTLFIVLSSIFYLDHGKRALQKEPNKGKHEQKNSH